jgi:hypothetical protein
MPERFAVTVLIPSDDALYLAVKVSSECFDTVGVPEKCGSAALTVGIIDLNPKVTISINLVIMGSFPGNILF